MSNVALNKTICADLSAIIDFLSVVLARRPHPRPFPRWEGNMGRQMHTVSFSANQLPSHRGKGRGWGRRVKHTDRRLASLFAPYLTEACDVPKTLRCRVPGIVNP